MEDWKANTVDFAPIYRVLGDLPIALDMRIDREVRGTLEAAHKALPMLLRSQVRVAAATFAAIRTLTFAKQHRGAHGTEEGELPPASLAVAVSPLARTFLDCIFTLLFIFEKPTERMHLYVLSGWSSATEHLGRLRARYGQDPVWADSLRVRSDWIDSHDADLGITPQQKNNPALLGPRRFPNPGKMVTRVSDPAIQKYLRYLDDWFYAQLSQEAHLSYMGLVKHGGLLVDENTGETQERHRHEVYAAATMLYIALLSEVAIACRLDQERARLHTIWQELNGFPQAFELWQERYEKAL